MANLLGQVASTTFFETPPFRPMNRNTVFILTGALLGAVLGHAVFVWLAKSHGAFGFAIPGVLVGIGASFHRDAPGWVAALCGVIGLVAGAYSTWTLMPFIADDGFGYFITHLHQLPAFQSGLILVGAGVAFWLPFRRRQR